MRTGPRPRSPGARAAPPLTRRGELGELSEGRRRTGAVAVPPVRRSSDRGPPDINGAGHGRSVVLTEAAPMCGRLCAGPLEAAGTRAVSGRCNSVSAATVVSFAPTTVNFRSNRSSRSQRIAGVSRPGSRSRTRPAPGPLPQASARRAPVGGRPSSWGTAPGSGCSRSTVVCRRPAVGSGGISSPPVVGARGSGRGWGNPSACRGLVAPRRRRREGSRFAR